MHFPELMILAVGLSMDAFAVAVCKGLSMKRATLGRALIVGLWFGGFQAGMPVLGYLLGVQFQAHIVAIDHWIAFALLAFIGGGMIRSAFSAEETACPDGALTPRAMLGLAVATSIDALAIGVTFAFLGVRILPAAAAIGVTTLALSMLGVRLGGLCGTRFRAKAEGFGGAILILLGFKILLEHLGVLNF